jgi:hypothetical protein
VLEMRLWVVGYEEEDRTPLPRTGKDGKAVGGGVEEGKGKARADMERDASKDGSETEGEQGVPGVGEDGGGWWPKRIIFEGKVDKIKGETLHEDQGGSEVKGDVSLMDEGEVRYALFPDRLGKDSILTLRVNSLAPDLVQMANRTLLFVHFITSSPADTCSSSTRLPTETANRSGRQKRSSQADLSPKEDASAYGVVRSSSPLGRLRLADGLPFALCPILFRSRARRARSDRPFLDVQGTGSSSDRRLCHRGDLRTSS